MRRRASNVRTCTLGWLVGPCIAGGPFGQHVQCTHTDTLRFPASFPAHYLRALFYVTRKRSEQRKILLFLLLLPACKKTKGQVRNIPLSFYFQKATSVQDGCSEVFASPSERLTSRLPYLFSLRPSAHPEVERVSIFDLSRIPIISAASPFELHNGGLNILIFSGGGNELSN